MKDYTAKDEAICTGQCGYSQICRQCEREKLATIPENIKITEGGEQTEVAMEESRPA
ncbi:MAG: hypothetical protein K9K75_03030 [Deltaproteobacteria bacterium]|nr:hypothetical protein [Deltaproteobacteria bacterium]